MQSVNSSQISQVGYNTDSKEILIEFNSGAVYAYHGASEQEFQNLLNAESVGKYFIANIKNKYEFSKL